EVTVPEVAELGLVLPYAGGQLQFAEAQLGVVDTFFVLEGIDRSAHVSHPQRNGGVVIGLLVDFVGDRGVGAQSLAELSRFVLLVQALAVVHRSSSLSGSEGL